MLHSRRSFYREAVVRNHSFEPRQDGELYTEEFSAAVARIRKQNDRIRQQVPVRRISLLLPPQLPYQGDDEYSDSSSYHTSAQDIPDEGQNDTAAYGADLGSRYRMEGPFWPWLVPYADRVYYWTVYVIFLVSFSIKKFSFLLLFIIDTALRLLVIRPVFFVLRGGRSILRRWPAYALRVRQWRAQDLPPRLSWAPLALFMVLLVIFCACIWILPGTIDVIASHRHLKLYTPELKNDGPLVSATFSSVVSYAARLLLGARRPSRTPLIALFPDTSFGSCWPMKGSQGSLTIILSQPVFVEGITIEHPGKQYLANPNLAPKDIAVYGLIEFKQGLLYDRYEKVPLGRANYDIHNDSPTQTFYFEKLGISTFQGILVQIESNWGNPDYTCLYRIHIHGTPLI